MDGSGYRLGITAGISILSVLISLCVMGLDATIIRLAAIVLVLCVAAAAGYGCCGAAGGGLCVIMLAIDSMSAAPEGLASFFMCIAITTLAVTICYELTECSSCDYYESPAPPAPLQVEIVRRRRRRRRRRQRRENSRCS